MRCLTLFVSHRLIYVRGIWKVIDILRIPASFEHVAKVMFKEIDVCINSYRRLTEYWWLIKFVLIMTHAKQNFSRSFMLANFTCIFIQN